MFDEDDIIDGSNFMLDEEFSTSSDEDLQYFESEVLKELAKASSSREEAEPALQKIFNMRTLDSYYNYLSSYNMDFLQNKTPLILKYQVFNEKTEFYEDDSDYWNCKIKTGIADDILDMFVEKVLTTPLRFFSDPGYKNEIKENYINPVALKTIFKGVSKYEHCLIIVNDITFTDNSIIEDGEIISVASKKHSINSVTVYPPHMYDMNKKLIIKKGKNGDLEKISFANTDYVELHGESLLGRKSELVYLISLMVTNFGVESESGKMKIHIDERYGEGLSKDVYSIYDAIHSGGTKDHEPLWKFTQGNIRPNEWKSALEIALYLVSRSVGIDLRGTVYQTATQANISNLDDIVKINSKLIEFQFLINKVLSEILGLTNVHARFDTFSHDNLDQELTRLQTAYTMGALLVEDYMKKVYKLLNLGEPTAKQIAMLKIERNVPLTRDEDEKFALELDSQSKEFEGE